MKNFLKKSKSVFIVGACLAIVILMQVGICYATRIESNTSVTGAISVQFKKTGLYKYSIEVPYKITKMYKDTIPGGGYTNNKIKTVKKDGEAREGSFSSLLSDFGFSSIYIVSYKAEIYGTASITKESDISVKAEASAHITKKILSDNHVTHYYPKRSAVYDIYTKKTTQSE